MLTYMDSSGIFYSQADLQHLHTNCHLEVYNPDHLKIEQYVITKFCCFVMISCTLYNLSAPSVMYMFSFWDNKYFYF